MEKEIETRRTAEEKATKLHYKIKWSRSPKMHAPIKAVYSFPELKPEVMEDFNVCRTASEAYLEYCKYRL